MKSTRREFFAIAISCCGCVAAALAAPAAIPADKLPVDGIYPNGHKLAFMGYSGDPARDLANGYLIVKDETLKPVKKNLRIAVGDSPEGPFGPASAPFTPSWAEGPTAIRIGDDYVVYFDLLHAASFSSASHERS